jgi:hypothetical protein
VLGLSKVVDANGELEPEASGERRPDANRLSPWMCMREG